MKVPFNSFMIFLVLIKSTEISCQSNIYSGKTGWTLSTSFQVTGGGYIYNEYNMLYLLYGGIRYQNNDLTLYGYIPVVAQNNPGFTQSGMMIIPTGRENEGGGGMMNGGNMHGENNSMNQTSMMDMQVTLGDFYLYGSYQLLNEIDHSMDLFVNPNIKFPTASAGSTIGTGKFDYGLSMNVRRSIESFVILAEAGFIKIGDPSGVDYKDPFTYGIGLGKFISDNGSSILFYFYSYTKIIDNYEPPRQVSLGLNLKLNSTTALSFTGFKGLSSYSPDFSISTGINFDL
ncbi:MAG: hypothetical protein A2V93_00255 [Ignavibacteria bacterium RBG_16_34_14]|nr:MAG: hypothetical protein A2V93_00255 [Ignavibacteria bacterium RBG_16_34_14]